MFELGPEKLLMLLLICLVIFGGKRIPEIGGSIGKGIREFKRGISEIGEEVKTPPPAPVSATSVAAANDDLADIRPEPKRLT
ncbi:MAG TPA: twin-arginine translocase TatA/TatE family subunit [Gemmatimonadaceae bacterium]|jgi:sec-independent protein translocase protein TatA